MFSKIRLSLAVTLSLLATQATFSQAQPDSLLDVAPYSSNNSDRLPQAEDGWTTLTVGQNVYGIRYDQPGAVIVDNNLVMSCVPYPQSGFETGLYVSQPSPLKKFVLVLCSQYPGDQAYVIDTVHGRAVSRDAVPKHWSIIKWVSWSPDERFALVAAAGEEPMGDMAFVDLGTGEMREIHFKDVTNNPRTDRHDRLQDFDPDAIAWLTASSFQLRLDVRCNPYEYGDACDYKKILSSHPARVNLNPFSISYGDTGQVKTIRARRVTARKSQTGRGIRSVNFRNFTYTIVGSDGRTESIVLHNGKNLSPGESTPFEYGSKLKSIKYVDFDGDGNEEALITIYTNGEGADGYWVENYFVFAYRNGSPVQIFNKNIWKSEGIQVAGKSLVISAPFWREQDPECCPYATEVTVYQWRGSGFARISRKLKSVR